MLAPGSPGFIDGWNFPVLERGAISRVDPGFQYFFKRLYYEVNSALFFQTHRLAWWLQQLLYSGNY